MKSITTLTAICLLLIIGGLWKVLPGDWGRYIGLGCACAFFFVALPLAIYHGTK